MTGVGEERRQGAEEERALVNAEATDWTAVTVTAARESRRGAWEVVHACHGVVWCDGNVCFGFLSSFFPCMEGKK